MFGHEKSCKTSGTRDAILTAALDLFSSQGYAGTSVREIARAVGVRESALYAHFPSKREILQTLFRTMGPGAAIDVLQNHFVGCSKDDIRLRLHSLTDLMFESWSNPSERKFARLILMEAVKRSQAEDDSVFELIRLARVKIIDVFRDLIERNIFKKIDPLLLSLEFIAVLHLVRQDSFLFRYDNDDLTLARELFQKHIEIFCQLAIKESED